MADIDAAIGYVVAHGDPVDRARLSWLRSGVAPAPEIVAKAEMGQAPSGGWPAFWAGDVASIDATCFRLAELDDLGALHREPARKALRWLAARQRPDGTWEEDESLAGSAPDWAQPGDPEARLYLTANAGFWLAVAGPPEPPPSREANAHNEVVARATQAFRAAMRDDGSWPSYLVAGWLGAALLYHAEWFYEAAQIQVILAERVPDMTPADVAWLAATLRRVGVSADDWLLTAARKRLTETQRSDGGWPSDDGAAFDVHATLTAIRALR
jgi:Prenyltransferase and squalene oxidase repeat